MIRALDTAALHNDPGLAEALLDLNNAHAVELSLLDADRLAQMVSEAFIARRVGLARALYGDLIAQARAAGHQLIVCEVNADPPNPASEAFHRSFGFEPVGEALLPNGKTVSYLALRIAAS